ncbi:hypothetical protein [Streptomyces chartreusis]|uniref:hypothetical protein n=1 Tax=Streptomyces chartreusis TaxID=1969 RepID=UPI002E1867D1
MNTWRPHPLLRWYHALLGTAGLLVALALLIAALLSDGSSGPLYVIAAVAALFGVFLLLLAFKRRLTLTATDVSVCNVLTERRVSLDEIADARPGRGSLYIQLTSGSIVKAYAVGTYHWLTRLFHPNISRASTVSAAINTAAAAKRSTSA